MEYGYSERRKNKRDKKAKMRYNKYKKAEGTGLIIFRKWEAKRIDC